MCVYIYIYIYIYIYTNWSLSTLDRGDKMNETWGAGLTEDVYFEKASLFFFPLLQ